MKKKNLFNLEKNNFKFQHYLLRKFKSIKSHLKRIIVRLIKFT